MSDEIKYDGWLYYKITETDVFVTVEWVIDKETYRYCQSYNIQYLQHYAAERFVELANAEISRYKQWYKNV